MNMFYTSWRLWFSFIGGKTPGLQTTMPDGRIRLRG
jgi:hypothetical protein